MLRTALMCLLFFFCSVAVFGQDTTTTYSGLKYVILEEGEGRQAYANRRVTVSYIGRLENGQVFDSSGAANFTFITGHGEVIKGWDEGIRLMAEGSLYSFIIPPKLAYGKKGYHNIIPPNSTLHFEVRLLKVENL
jgi:FKBP-type peptidyl-prolyl cis-trans isomerase